MTVSSPPRPPAQDEPEALIPEARDRQRRRQLLVLASVAIAVALGLGIYGLATGGGPLGTIRGSLGLSSAPTCRSQQLKAHSIFYGFGLRIPSGGGGVEFRNTSGSTCSLPLGIPRASLFWRGQRLAVSQIQGAHPFRLLANVPAEPVVHVLGPGKTAQIDFVWRNWCGPAKMPTWYQVNNRPPKGPPPPQVTLGFRFGKAPVVIAANGYAPKCTQPGAPSTIRASQPLYWGPNP